MSEKSCATCSYQTNLFGQSVCTYNNQNVLAVLMRRMGGCGTNATWYSQTK